MIALLASLFLAQVCDANALYPTSEPGGDPSVAAGQSICYDTPTDSVCCEADLGDLRCTAGGESTRWDGVTFCLNDACTVGVGNNAGVLFFKGANDNSFQLSNTAFFASLAGGPSIFEGSSLTTPGFIPDRSGGTVGVGGDGDNVSLLGGVVANPSATQTLLAAGQIDPTAGKYVPVAGSGGAVTLTSNPQIIGTNNGQEVCLVGTSDTNRVEVVDGNGLALAGDVNFELSQHDTICFVYMTASALYVELTRSNN